MNEKLNLEGARWIEPEGSLGRFRTSRDTLGRPVTLARLSEIKAEIEAADAEGGAFTSEDVLSYVDQHLSAMVPEARE